MTAIHNLIKKLFITKEKIFLFTVISMYMQLKTYRESASFFITVTFS